MGPNTFVWSKDDLEETTKQQKKPPPPNLLPIALLSHSGQHDHPALPESSELRQVCELHLTSSPPSHQQPRWGLGLDLPEEEESSGRPPVQAPELS